MIGLRALIRAPCIESCQLSVEKPRAGRGWACLHATKHRQPLPVRLHGPSRPLNIVYAGGSDQQEKQIQDLKVFATTPIFKYWIQGGVFLAVLAGVDAAYSGDWSRIGVISKEFEDSLKPLVVALGFFHIGCAVVAGRSAASKNLDVLPAVLKVLAVGFLAMVEVLAAEPQPSQQ